MSKSKIITIALILFALITFWFIFKNSISKTSLVVQPIPSNTPTPAPTPKTFKFDKSTDLKKELEGVNPQVLDSDFE